ncbi:efflux RND transporter periplasmic adaptor subunit [Muribaculum intestinale]|jgi:membrane fusion protein (multidrug efflux system)|uniref:Efflux transporter periplasmic adaptor subunit n=1 Tax=Muribaculum intestinale TaxID=1796646 RepID=A0A1B1SDM3_9BACT|nr:efflux RND transporter periplasmic adaptor subunit [Muribaculum intestinale]ROS80038.1 efflux RND transporter periplasmic adaptor subunit [Muribaculaceae bacterium Isolate-042 (Harlan)]ANU64833.2 efflux transporter periplasmic adaptor subunit [Muribaculum intestinale]ASB37931.1 efflux transporter periplasmic adaptor subunit [Muribaculum intestinale]PWB04035.1 efflux RND transporter periplasmic adaptor subunit [Muribaculum intestinale]PWB10764.1 efflux RND transporter periplasmic adaptor sub
MKLNSAKTVGTSLIAGVAVVLASCGGGQQQQQMPVPQIATMTVEYGNSELESAYPVTIKGRTDIAIRPQVSGFITKVHVDEGQQVRKGQVLFTLDQVQYQAAVDAAQAAIRVAESAVNTAQLTADNKRRLYDKNIISEYEWQMADNQLKQAKAQLASANAQLVTAQKNLAYTVVTAPSDGVIGSIPNREGSLASPSSMEPLTTVSDNSEVYAYFSLNEKDILGMTDNGARSLNSSVDAMPPVSLRLANGEIYPEKGKVATVSGVIDNTTGAATVRALFNNPSGMLRSGSTGSVLIPNSFEKVIIIPQSATSELQNIRFAYVVNDSNKIVATPIQVSPISDGKNFIVVSGLEVGQRIAVEGVGTSVRDGITIQPVDASTQPQGAPQAAPDAAKE